MARTSLTVQDISISGVTPSYSSANVDGNSFANDGDVFLHVKNGSGSDITLTVQTPAKVNGVDIEEVTVTVSAGSEEMVGPFPTTTFNQSGGVVYADYSAVTTVTVAAIKLA